MNNHPTPHSPTKSLAAPIITAKISTDDIHLLEAHHSAAINPETAKAQQQDIKTWILWCNEHGVNPQQPGDGDICLWLSHMAADGAPNRLEYNADNESSRLIAGTALSMKTIDRRLSSVKSYLKDRKCSIVEHDRVKNHLKGIKRTHVRRKLKKAEPIYPEKLKTIAGSADYNCYKGLRDRAILLLGFSGALRVSDIAYIQPDNIKMHPGGRGIVLTFETRKSKHDISHIEIYHGKDPVLCPVLALQKLTKAYPPLPGIGIFRGTTRHGSPTRNSLKPDTIARIIKEHAAAAGYKIGDGSIQGHSLRRGYINTALLAGRSIPDIMKVTGHSDPKTLVMYQDELGDFNGESLI